jgi:hypothetical protein
VRQLNNKSLLLEQLKDMKRKTRERQKAYWAERQKLGQISIEGGCSAKGQGEIVDPGANTEPVFQHQQPDSHDETPITKNDSLHSSNP